LTIFDEHGYYLTEDTALLWAQARSLNFWLVSAGQDIQAYFRTSKEETKAIIANCNTKIVGKLEDPTETFEMVEALGGEALISTVGDYDLDIDGVAGGYLEGKSVKVERVKRITLQDLQRQVEGEVHLMVSGDIVRGRMFYADPPAAKHYRLNHFIKVIPPSRETADALRINTRALIDSLLDSETAFPRLRPADPYFAYVGELLRQPHVERYHAQRLGAERGIALLMAYVEQPVISESVQGAGGGPRNTPGEFDTGEESRGVVLPASVEPGASEPVGDEALEFDAANLATVNVFEGVPQAITQTEVELHAASAEAAAAVIGIAHGVLPGFLDAQATRVALRDMGATLGADPDVAEAAAESIIATAAAATTYPNPPTPPPAEAAADLMQTAMDELESLLTDGGAG
jgi:intracellular multiplication protein IcmO